MLFSQKEAGFRDNPLPAKYLLKGSSDTIYTHIAGSYAFKKNHFTADTFMKNIRTEENGVKVKVPVENIRYLEITDFDNTVRKFTTSDYFPNLKLRGVMLEIAYRGKKVMVLREQYTINMYGNTASNYYTFEGRELLRKARGFSDQADALKARLQPYPDLLELFKKVKKEEEYYTLLADYENK